jgi:3-methyladenine DNA glycosylase/8-oxoguanine DNA glycosylase
VATARAQEIRTGLAWLHAADPVLAQVIDERPDFDPDLWVRRLPAMDLFAALVFQIIGQQISVITATAIFARLTERFGGRVPGAGELAAVDQGTYVVSGCLGARPPPCWIWRGASATDACPRPDCASCLTRR